MRDSSPIPGNSRPRHRCNRLNARNTLARCHLNARNYEETVTSVRRVISVRSNFPPAYYLLASALGHLGRLDEARKALVNCEKLQPGFVDKRATWKPYLDPKDNEHILDGVRKVDGI